ncbi:hypothetical protein GMMP13_810079 [Candidatus Magnetomoraceae bacterium gMMP-13]
MTKKKQTLFQKQEKKNPVGPTLKKKRLWKKRLAHGTFQ